MKEEFVGWVDDEGNIVLDHDQPIVRCRDCNCMFETDNPISRTGYWCAENRRPTALDDFCSWGERR